MSHQLELILAVAVAVALVFGLVRNFWF